MPPAGCVDPEGAIDMSPRRMTRDEERPLSIGALSRVTRIPVETLRTWERRYGALRPIRKPSGHRIYPASVVEHLRRVSRLLSRGHRPAEVLSLADADLDALLALDVEGAPATGVPQRTTEESLAALLEATRALDRRALFQELRAAWVRLGPVPFLEAVAGRFLVEIGRAWESGALDVRHEHFASACLSDFLRAAREPYDQRARGAGVVAAMLPDEAHEGGLLLVAALLAVRGRRVLYLGPRSPIPEIAAAARSSTAEAIAISVSAATPARRAAAQLQALRRAVPPRVRIWLGGAGAPRAVRGVERFDSLAGLDAALDAPG